MHRQVHAQGLGSAWLQVKGIEGQPCPPGVVQHAQHALLSTGLDLRDQIRELHGHRARRFQPHQAGLRADALAQVVHVQRVVQLVANAPAGELVLGQRFVGGIGVVGDQHLIAVLQQSQIGMGNGGQAAGDQQGVHAALE